jgi:hypothetical protein
VAIAKAKNDVTLCCGQGNSNRFGDFCGLYGTQRFQFGDLRAELPDRRIIIEVESCGGITNLAKYWLRLANHSDDKVLFLIHLFRTSSKNDYKSHRLLWEFIWDRMKKDAVGKLVAKLFTYTNLDKGLDPAIGYFKRCLSEPLGSLHT